MINLRNIGTGEYHSANLNDLDNGAALNHNATVNFGTPHSFLGNIGESLQYEDDSHMRDVSEV